MIVADSGSDVAIGSDELARQLRLRLHHAAIIAHSFWRAGYSALIDDIVAGSRFDELARDLDDVPYGFVMLLPELAAMKEKWRAMGSPFAESWDWIDDNIRQHTPRVGLWIDTTQLTADKTVAEILRHLSETKVQ